MSETAEVRLRRLSMRSHRRGTKEMDIILGRFADDSLAAMASEELDLYEALLEENDHDLYQWVSGLGAAPARFAGLVGEIAAQAVTAARG